MDHLGTVNQVNPGWLASMLSWQLHTDHLYKTLWDVYLSKLEPEGKAVAQIVLEEFAGQFGNEAAAVVVSSMVADF